MGDLFDYDPPAPKPTYGTDAHKLARTEGPDTSHAAAQSVDTTALERMVHRAIARHSQSGCIADEVLDQFPGHAYSSITARFSALERKGLISCGPDKRKGRSGRGQRVMRSIREVIED